MATMPTAPSTIAQVGTEPVRLFVFGLVIPPGSRTDGGDAAMGGTTLVPTKLTHALPTAFVP